MQINFAERFQHVMDQINGFAPVMLSVMGFKPRSDNPKEPTQLETKKEALALAIEAGVDSVKLRAAEELLKAMYRVLSSFIYFSVNEKRIGDGEGAYMRPGKFTALLRVYREAPYHQDIVDGLVAKINVLQEAIRVEKENDFSQRIPAYNAVFVAFVEAEKEQGRRDEARLAVERDYPGRGKGRRRQQENEKAANISDEAKSIADKRHEMLLARKNAAQQVQSLF